MEPMIQIKGLKKNYGKKEAVRGIDLDIPKGELFALLGPNGAGKTSTLKMLVGLLKPTEGTVKINGYDTQKETVLAKKSMSFVPDVPFVYDKLTPWELLRFTGKLYNLDAGLIKRRGEELLQFFSIWDVRHVLIEEFSHGMRQKTILSSALLHDPKAFILDEPMVGLDPISIKSFKDFLIQKKRAGMTILFSTHTLSTAEELADRIGIINHGKLIALGTLDELKGQLKSQENLEHMFMKLVSQDAAE